MAKIYLSYSHTDRPLIMPIVHGLRKRGHEIMMDTEVLSVGQDFRKALLKALKNSDGVVALITENSLKSNYVIGEIGAARAFVEEVSNRKFFMPVVYGDIDVPNIIQDLLFIRLNGENYENVLDQIDRSISTFYGRKEGVEEKENLERQKIESKASDYIEVAIRALEKREVQNKVVGTIWYILGFLTLAAGIGFTINGMSTLDQLINQNYWMYIIVILKSIIVIGLLIACSKYAFNLGKSFINEALRNADRIHAIAFGKFYLQAFGDKIGSAEEIKDVFQNWNIDKESAFQRLDTNSYDPKFTENLVEIVKNLSQKAKT